jgi:hypothetical protein
MDFTAALGEQVDGLVRWAQEGRRTKRMRYVRWSPDGKRLAYVLLHDAGKGWTISQDLDGRAWSSCRADYTRSSGWRTTAIYGANEPGEADATIGMKVSRACRRGSRKVTQWGGFCVDSTSSTMTASAWCSPNQLKNRPVIPQHLNSYCCAQAALAVDGRNWPVGWTADKSLVFVSSRNRLRSTGSHWTPMPRASPAWHYRHCAVEPGFTRWKMGVGHGESGKTLL